MTTDSSKRRVLRKILPGTFGRVTIPENNPTFPGDQNNWHYALTDDGAYYVFYQQSYFDLSGYTVEQETTFPAAVVFQEMEVPWVNGGAFIHVVDYVTKTNISEADLTDSVSGFPVFVGQPGSRFDLEEIFYANLTLWRDSLDAGNSPLPAGTTRWGVGQATAAEKIYITRAFYLSIGDASVIQQFQAPPCAVVIPCTIVEEPDLEYIMRLKRSHELAE